MAPTQISTAHFLLGRFQHLYLIKDMLYRRISYFVIMISVFMSLHTQAISAFIGHTAICQGTNVSIYPHITLNKPELNLTQTILMLSYNDTICTSMEVTKQEMLSTFWIWHDSWPWHCGLSISEIAALLQYPRSTVSSFFSCNSSLKRNVQL